MVTGLLMLRDMTKEVMSVRFLESYIVCTISTTVLVGSEKFGAYNGVITSLTRESGSRGLVFSISVGENQIRHINLV